MTIRNMLSRSASNVSYDSSGEYNVTPVAVLGARDISIGHFVTTQITFTNYDVIHIHLLLAANVAMNALSLMC